MNESSSTEDEVWVLLEKKILDDLKRELDKELKIGRKIKVPIEWKEYEKLIAFLFEQLTFVYFGTVYLNFYKHDLPMG